MTKRKTIRIAKALVGIPGLEEAIGSQWHVTKVNLIRQHCVGECPIEHDARNLVKPLLWLRTRSLAGSVVITQGRLAMFVNKAWLKYCGTAGKPGRNRENKPRPKLCISDRELQEETQEGNEA